VVGCVNMLYPPLLMLATNSSKINTFNEEVLDSERALTNRT